MAKEMIIYQLPYGAQSISAVISPGVSPRKSMRCWRSTLRPSSLKMAAMI